ncbi:MAG TPA: UDP-N-acetylmuramate--L-alanine ligase [Lachnospiraceae bacterium]|nr:UDP-N-acetylmuramate--L-alanine ligase [Lachnospiraceae bacterium]
MYQIDLNSPVHVHFIGIGGISMSGLAEILLSRGFTVSGSDNNESGLTVSLSEKGALIHIGQSAQNITDDIKLVVYTAAIHKDNPEFCEALRRGLPMLTRAELLGQIMKNYPLSAAVSGTHGKTTTTSMLTDILLEAGSDPTVSVGGMLKEIGGNIRIGSSGYFVTEACEYTNSFLSLYPRIGIILNIEEDHLDFFKDLSDIRASFRTFAKLIPKDGTLVINRDIDELSEFCSGLECGIVTFSSSEESDADYSPKDILFDDLGCASYTLMAGGRPECRIELKIPGVHNIANSLAAIAAAHALGISNEAVVSALKSFKGVDRRFEYKGSFSGVTVIDDYAHHPTEIEATLKAAGNYPHKTLWCVFQPHTYTRTKSFFNDFARALSLADKVVLADIYAARETDTLGVSSRMLSDAINENEGREDKSFYLDSFDGIRAFLIKMCRPGDLVITMGAGDIYKVGDSLLDTDHCH